MRKECLLVKTNKQNKKTEANDLTIWLATKLDHTKQTEKGWVTKPSAEAANGLGGWIINWVLLHLIINNTKHKFQVSALSYPGGKWLTKSYTVRCSSLSVLLVFRNQTTRHQREPFVFQTAALHILPQGKQCPRKVQVTFTKEKSRL